MAKTFQNLANKTGLAAQAGGFNGLITDTSGAADTETDNPPQPTTSTVKAATTAVSATAFRRPESISLREEHSEKLRDLVHLRHVQGKTHYTQRDAMDELLTIAFKQIGEIPERPEEVKEEERRRAQGRGRKPKN